MQRLPSLYFVSGSDDHDQLSLDGGDRPRDDGRHSAPARRRLDVIAGFFILFDNLIAVDDVIKVGDKSGRLEAVSRRNARRRDADGALHAIPYGAITTVTNLSRNLPARRRSCSFSA